MLLTFNSAVAVNQSHSNKHGDFEVKINPPINVGPNAKAALVSYSGYYSWHNMRSEFNNNTVRYSTDRGVSFREIIFLNGLYAYEDINAYFEGLEVKPAPVIAFNDTTYNVSIVVPKNCVLDMTVGDFADLLGFDRVRLGEGEYTSPNPPNLSRDLDSLYVHCDFVKDSIIDGSWGNVLFSFSTANLRPGYPFVMEPINLSYVGIASQTISAVHFYITDVFKRPVYLNKAPIRIVIVIKDD
jgi:hypothetical protein